MQDNANYLPHLYSRKFRLIERLEYFRKDYYTSKNALNQPLNEIKYTRPLLEWDYVLEEMKWTAIDMMEERKSKIAISQCVSKKIKKKIRQKKTHEMEVYTYHRLISSEMASIITRAFNTVKSHEANLNIDDHSQNRNGLTTTAISHGQKLEDEVIKIEDNYHIKDHNTEFNTSFVPDYLHENFIDKVPVGDLNSSMLLICLFRVATYQKEYDQDSLLIVSLCVQPSKGNPLLSTSRSFRLITPNTFQPYHPNQQSFKENEEILDYDAMKIEDEPINKKPNSTIDKQKLKDNFTKDMKSIFKNKTCHNMESKLLNYIIRTNRHSTNSSIIEFNDSYNQLKSLKIDRIPLLKELQKCFAKWNKNKASGSDLADIFSRLTKENVIEMEKLPKLNKDMSILSSISFKEERERKRKKTLPPITIPIKENGIQANANTNAQVVKKNTENPYESYFFNYKDMKKFKDRENGDELLTIWYEEPLTDAEFTSMFKISIENNKNFPKSIKDLTTVGFPTTILQTNKKYKEQTFDDSVDKIICDSKLELESFICDLGTKFAGPSYKFNEDAAFKNYLSKLSTEHTINDSDLIGILPYILIDNSFFIYCDKKIRYIKNINDIDNKPFETYKWPPYVVYVFEWQSLISIQLDLIQITKTSLTSYYKKYGNKWGFIADLMNTNLITKGIISKSPLLDVMQLLQALLTSMRNYAK